MNINIRQELLNLGIPPECIAQRSSADEHGRSFAIDPLKGEQIWRVKVDGCWVRGNQNRRIDYLFWVCTSNGEHKWVLVELKGSKYSSALEQIEQTLLMLTKQGIVKQLAIEMRAYVVLSKAQGVPQALAHLERLRKRFGIRVVAREKKIHADGFARLP